MELNAASTISTSACAAIMIVAGCQRIDLPCVQQIQDNEISLISSSKKVSPDMVETYLKAFKGVVSTKVADVTAQGIHGL